MEIKKIKSEFPYSFRPIKGLLLLNTDATESEFQELLDNFLSEMA
jgi:hypothetical protein